MDNTFIYVMGIDCRFAAVTPDHLARPAEMFLIVGKDN